MQSLTYNTNTLEKSKAVYNELLQTYGLEQIILAMLQNMNTSGDPGDDWFVEGDGSTDSSSEMQIMLSDLKTKYGL